MRAQSLSHVQLSSDPVDCSPPGSSVDGTLKARVLEWGAMPSSRGSSQPRDRTLVFCTAGGSLPPPPPGKPSKSNLYKPRPSRGSIYPVLSPQPRPSLLWGSKRAGRSPAHPRAGGWGRRIWGSGPLARPGKEAFQPQGTLPSRQTHAGVAFFTTDHKG